MLVVIAKIPQVCKPLYVSPARYIYNVPCLQKFVEITNRRVRLSRRKGMVLRNLTKMLFKNYSCYSARSSTETILQQFTCSVKFRIEQVGSHKLLNLKQGTFESP